MKNCYDKLEAFDLAQPSGATDAERLAAYIAPINVARVFITGEAKTIARQSATGDWSRIVLRSRQVATIPPATANDVAVLAAINVTESLDTDPIDQSNTATWPAWQAGIAALEASGDLSSASAALIAALSTQTTTQAAIDGWVNPPNEDDLAAARDVNRGAYPHV